MLYSYPKFSSRDLGILRFSGAGLGNLLVIWSRCIIQSKKFNLIPIAPTWAQIRPGPLLRREGDTRFYFNLFKCSKDNIRGIKKIQLLLRTKKIKEDKLYDGILPNEKNTIIIFEGLKNYFNDFLEEHDFLKYKLLNIVKPKQMNGYYYPFGRSISLHVRMGDYRKEIRTPFVWYIETIQSIRNVAGMNLPVYIFSDGTNDELNELLALQNTFRMNFGTSIADLLALSRSWILLASAHSTFSMWASFIGRMPVIWPQGSWRIPLYYDRPNFEIELGPGMPFSKEIVKYLKGNYSAKK
jgi:hypothetical protein